ncbi:MAG: ABC transporter substrate-binding protein [Acidimicrobiales bacterium]
MKQQRTARLCAVVAGLGLLAAACGGDDGGGSSEEAATAATVDQGVQKGVQDALSGSSTTAAEGDDDDAAAAAEPKAHPTTLEDWEALWEEERAAVVEKIKDGGYGIAADGKSALISDGYTIDLSACASGWSDTEGLSDTEIKIGHTTAQSGTLAIYGQIATAMGLYFADVNKAGGITDSEGKTRTINLIVKDDGYDPARTIPLVDELIDAEKVFAMWTLGSPNTMKTYDKLNQRCIPQPLSMTGHPAWGDPVKHPWTTGLQLAYNTESVLIGAFIEERAEEFKADDGKIIITSLALNNDAGKAFDGGVRAWLAQSPIKADVEYINEVIEPASPTVTDPMTTLASKNADVFISQLGGAACTQAVVEAAQNGMHESVDYLFQSSVCKSNGFMGKDKVGGDGSASEGWWVVGGGLKTFDTAAYDNDPWAKAMRAQLDAAGIDWKTNATHLTGNAMFAWTAEQALRIASDLDGGLTRVNFMIALRNMDMTAPFLLEVPVST